MPDVHEQFEQVDAFGVGAIGEVGQRVFLLQCRSGDTQITIKCEKQQAAAMAIYLRRVLSDLPPTSPDEVQVSPLQPPLVADFVLGQIGLGIEQSGPRVLVQLNEEGEVDEAGDVIDEDLSHVRLFLSPAQALAFCEQSEEAVAAGRPLCRWCDGPINPDGHLCPRMN